MLAGEDLVDRSRQIDAGYLDASNQRAILAHMIESTRILASAACSDAPHTPTMPRSGKRPPLAPLLRSMPSILGCRLQDGSCQVFNGTYRPSNIEEI